MSATVFQITLPRERVHDESMFALAFQAQRRNQSASQITLRPGPQLAIDYALQRGECFAALDRSSSAGGITCAV